MREDDFGEFVAHGAEWTAVRSSREGRDGEIVFVGRIPASDPSAPGFVAKVRRHSTAHPDLVGEDFPDQLTKAERAHLVAPHELPAHIANARECFDGMRAYHSSEISHTGHALDLLKGILASTLATYGAMIALASGSSVRGDVLSVLAVLFLIGVVRVLWVVTSKTIEKVSSDHVRYEEFRTELNKERALLGLHATWGLRHRRNRPGSGYKFTHAILKDAALAMGSLALLGCLLVVALVWLRVG